MSESFKKRGFAEITDLLEVLKNIFKLQKED
jgi:hypothetical protein